MLVVKNVCNSILNSIDERLYIVDSNLRITQISRQLQQDYQERGKAAGRHCYEAFFSRSTPCAVCPTIRAFASRRREIDNKEVCINGLDVSIELQSDPVADEQTGEIIGAVVRIREVRLSDEASGRQERSFQSLVYELPALICEFRQDSTLTFVNRTYCEYFGMTPEQLIGKPFFDFLPEDDREKARQAFLALTPENPVKAYSHQVLHQGKLTWQSWLDRAVFNERGEAVKYQSVGFDITEQQEAKEQLADSQRRLSLAQTLAEIGTWEYGIHSGHLYWTPECEALFGLSAGSFTETFDAFLEFVHPEDRDYVIAVNKPITADRKGHRFDYEHRIIRTDGAVRWVREFSGLVHDEAGEPEKIIGLVMDITELKRQEQKQEHLQRQLSQAQKMESVGRLAGGIAHDYNNMLGVILGRTELAMELLDSQDPAYAELQDVHSAALSSSRLTKQLLVFSRQQPHEPKHLDVNEAVDQTLKMVSNLIGEDIELTWRPGAGPMGVNIDPTQLDQILLNIVINSRDAIESTGEITISTEFLTVAASRQTSTVDLTPGEYVKLSIRDTGSGMDQETMDKVFDPFFTTKTCQKGGTGLGLPTVYGIVKQNSGGITVSSEPGKGTDFAVWLPRTEAAEQNEQPRQKQPPRGSREHILVVEDDESMLEVVQSMLSGLGYQPLGFTHGSDALKGLESIQGAVPLMITDLIMPDISGRELAETVLRRYSGMKILFMSGYTSDIIEQQGMLPASSKLIHKPFSLAEIGETVHEMLRQEP